MSSLVQQTKTTAKLTKKKKTKKGINLDSKNGRWKGTKAQYAAIHDYIRRRKQKPEQCESCHKKTIWLDLAFINPDRAKAKYTRKISDYQYLYRLCHMTQDKRIDRFYNSEAQRKVSNRKKKSQKKEKE